MALNEDILHEVLRYEHAQTLVDLCCVSRSIRRAAVPRLYRRVNIRGMKALDAFHGALERDNSLAAHVVHFLEHLPRNEPLYYQDRPPGPQQWRAHFLQQLLDIFRRTTNTETVSLVHVANLGDDVQKVVSALAELPNLRNVHLPWVKADLLQLLGTRRPLECIGVLQRHKPQLYHWLASHAQQLRYLRIDEGSGHLCSLVDDYPSVVFPHLHTLTARWGDLLSVNEYCAQAFPALRALYFSHPLVSDIPARWPRLEHLAMHLCDTDYWNPIRLLPQDHPVRSLSIRPRVPALVKPRELDLVRAWASPHVRALSLLWWGEGCFELHKIALSDYRGLVSLDIHLPPKVAVSLWIKDVVALPAVPNLEVLTVHVRGGNGDLTDGCIESLRARFPALRLVRVLIPNDCPPELDFGPPTVQRIVWPPSVDWATACDIVADYFPPWSTELRAPWDDITRIEY